ncbi:hypothetical protein DFQ27_006537, partial [Actinomortierella ambigua]
MLWNLESICTDAASLSKLAKGVERSVGILDSGESFFETSDEGNEWKSMIHNRGFDELVPESCTAVQVEDNITLN